MQDESSLRLSICEYGALLWARNLFGATEGNISARLAEDRILCTPSGRSKGHLRPDHLVVVGLDGKVLGGTSARLGFRESASSPAAATPSSELKMHLQIYQSRPDAQAVIHAHPLTATGFAYAGVTIPTSDSPEGQAVLGEVALLPFAAPGTDEVPASFLPFVDTNNAFLLTNHGATTIGTTLEEAFNRMETLERLAQITLVARQLRA